MTIETESISIFVNAQKLFQKYHSSSLEYIVQSQGKLPAL